ncbi:Pr6Pr family membrane protein [Salinibacterium sp.]|uniref:Pr6Pr family membrane protein n=1 Tax=Salinibacterium sp. TaxID=1915057 RepID=UPI00286AE64D|nr:Pr6Pr family membrane protein [Salinibacterium sp.]
MLDVATTSPRMLSGAPRLDVGVVRLAFAVVCVVALVARYIWGLGSATFAPSNYYAYLTIQSNIAFATVMAIAGVLACRTARDPDWLTTVRAGVLTCTITAGIVFAVIVQQSGSNTVPIDVPWSDIILHFWLPPLAALEWFLSPGRGRAPWRIVVFVLGYTLSWGGLTMLRGTAVGWYPYYFLDPGQLDGVAEFFTLSGLSLAVFTVVGLGVVGVTRLRRKA